MRGDIVADSWEGLFLGDEVVDGLIEIFCNHLGVRDDWFRFDGSGENDGFVSCGDGSFEIFEFVMVDEGVVALVTMEIVVKKVGQLPAKDSVFHVSVRVLLYFLAYKHKTYNG